VQILLDLQSAFVEQNKRSEMVSNKLGEGINKKASRFCST
jgi:hypothetical protein